MPSLLESGDAAVAAGFDALSPDVFWLRALQKEGVSLERLREALDARGLGCMEIAGIAVEAPAETLAALEETVRYAEGLGAEFANVRFLVAPDAAGQELLCRCEDALAKVGTRIALEFSRGTKTRNISETLSLIESAETRSAGVTLDTWHFFLARDGPDWSAFEALPLSKLANVQLSDGVPVGDQSYYEATLNERRLPGEGEFDLTRFAQVLRRKDFDGAVIVEVLSAQLRNLPVEDFALQAGATSRRWWAAA